MHPASENTEHHVLVIDDGNQRRVLQLDAVAYSIGRDPSNAIVLRSDPAISRQHALLIRLPVPNQGYRYRLLDGNSEGKRSANGVFINGNRHTMHELVKGDQIRFGKNVQATYHRVAMGETEFGHYIEGLSYQSLKSDIVDAKATLVSPEALGLDDLMQTMISAGPVATPATVGQTSPQVISSQVVDPGQADPNSVQSVAAPQTSAEMAKTAPEHTIILPPCQPNNAPKPPQTLNKTASQAVAGVDSSRSTARLQAPQISQQSQPGKQGMASPQGAAPGQEQPVQAQSEKTVAATQAPARTTMADNSRMGSVLTRRLTGQRWEKIAVTGGIAIALLAGIVWVIVHSNHANPDRSPPKPTSGSNRPQALHGSPPVTLER